MCRHGKNISKLSSVVLEQAMHFIYLFILPFHALLVVSIKVFCLSLWDSIFSYHHSYPPTHPCHSITSPTSGLPATVAILNIFRRLYLYDCLFTCITTKIVKEDELMNFEAIRGKCGHERDRKRGKCGGGIM